MEQIVGEEIYIQSYKHDGKVHRTWMRAFVVEETEEYTVAITNKAWVVEADGRRWLTKEPAVCFLYHHRWFNIISMIRKDGVFYYCNLASPSIYDGEAIKNIDYDFDLKFYPDGHFDVLDEDEFNSHSKKMNYPKEIKSILQEEMKELIHLHRKKEIPFNEEEVYRLHELYLTMNRREANKER